MPDLELTADLSIHYLDLNPQAGRTILLLHGLGADESSWQLQFPELTAQSYRILAPDAPGFGQSTYPSGSPSSIQATAHEFVHLIDKLGIQELDLVGISMGGAHALAIALECPQLVRRLVLVNTFAHLRPHGLNEWLYYALRFVLVHTLGLEVQANTVAARIFPRPEQADLRQVLIGQILQADPRAYRAAMRALAKFNVVARLSEMNVPTLVVTGEQDTTVPRDVQQQLVQGIPGARQVFIPGAGHAVSVDRADMFNQILIDFLNSSPPESSHPA